MYDICTSMHLLLLFLPQLCLQKSDYTSSISYCKFQDPLTPSQQTDEATLCNGGTVTSPKSLRIAWRISSDLRPRCGFGWRFLAQKIIEDPWTSCLEKMCESTFNILKLRVFKSEPILETLRDCFLFCDYTLTLISNIPKVKQKLWNILEFTENYRIKTMTGAPWIFRGRLSMG